MSIFIDCGDDVDGNYLFVVVFIIIHANDFVMMLPDSILVMCTSARLCMMAQSRRVLSI